MLIVDLATASALLRWRSGVGSCGSDLGSSQNQHRGAALGALWRVSVMIRKRRRELGDLVHHSIDLIFDVHFDHAETEKRRTTPISLCHQSLKTSINWSRTPWQSEMSRWAEQPCAGT